MPSLIVSSLFSQESKILRQAARRLGWETARSDSNRLPEGFHPPDRRFAVYAPAPGAFHLAAHVSCRLLGCPADWTVGLPTRFLNRRMEMTTLEQARRDVDVRFVKPALGKSFAARVYDHRALCEATASRPLRMRVHVADPVTWEREYRCFVLEGRVVTTSAYRRDGRTVRDLDDNMGAGPSELNEARGFSQAVLDSVASPPAFVLDVGVIEGRGWSVVEVNECWASGIYTCDRERVLATLLGACVPGSKPAAWDSGRFHREAGGR